MKTISIYIAKDNEGVKMFKDKPDRVRFSPDTNIIWQGYPLDNHIYNKYHNAIIKKVSDELKTMTIYDEPLYIEFYI